MNKTELSDEDFLDFIASHQATSKLGINLVSANITKGAQKALAEKYPSLAKNHVAKPVILAYYTNALFREKFEKVCGEYGIAITRDTNATVYGDKYIESDKKLNELESEREKNAQALESENAQERKNAQDKEKEINERASELLAQRAKEYELVKNIIK